MVYLPLIDETEGERLQQDYPLETDEILEIFYDEPSLIKRSITLLYAKGRPSILLGYNSLNYDSMFLATRCVFHRLVEFYPLLYFRGAGAGISFGIAQQHIDLYRISYMMYQLPHYNLQTIAKHILQEEKNDLDAVLIRDTFFKIFDTDRYDSKEHEPKLVDILLYNKKDVDLVTRLEKSVDFIEMAKKMAKDCISNVEFLQMQFNKMQYRVFSELFRIGIEHDTFLGHLNDNSRALNIRIPPRIGGDVIQVWHAEETRVKLANSKGRYPGGLNFCLGAMEIQDLQAYDYRVAYPLLMERLNLSDETCGIYPANILLAMYDELEGETYFESYDYDIHSGTSTTETRLIVYRAIYEKNKSRKDAARFPFVRHELASRGQQLVILVWKGRKGILSYLLNIVNTRRESMKDTRKIYEGAIEMLDEEIAIRRQFASEKKDTEEEEEEDITYNNNNEEEEENFDDFFMEDKTEEKKIQNQNKRSMSRVLSINGF